MRLLNLLAAAAVVSPTAQAQIALLTEFDHPPAAIAAAGMERELATLFESAGLELSLYNDGPYVALGSPHYVLSIHFTGHCQPAAMITARADATVLARLAMVDGQLLPLVVVDCDAVAQYIRGSMTGAGLRRADAVYGRALGRVVAHEIYHWVAQQAAHTRSKLFAERISAHTLLSDTALFEPAEVQLLRVSRSPDRPLGSAP